MTELQVCMEFMTYMYINSKREIDIEITNKNTQIDSTLILLTVIAYVNIEYSNGGIVRLKFLTSMDLAGKGHPG